MNGRKRWIIGLLLSCLAVSAMAALVFQVAATGFPHPAVLVLATLTFGASTGWWLATSPAMQPAACCRSCGGASLGWEGFGFCLRCGAQAI